MSEWQPIETAPKDGTQVLLYASGATIGSWLSSSVGWFCALAGEGDPVYDPTHWMSLPEPPEQKL